jgi:hypothetical protein
MSTFGREEDALWYENRARKARARGRELDARRYEKHAADTRAIMDDALNDIMDEAAVDIMNEGDARG